MPSAASLVSADRTRLSVDLKRVLTGLFRSVAFWVWRSLFFDDLNLGKFNPPERSVFECREKNLLASPHGHKLFL
jgi:hypothetical protein